MKCYIYFIINQVNGERYVGQTVNYSRRIKDHFYKLKNNIHVNQKLQNAYNKYGEENFSVEKIVFDNLSKEELNEMEIYYIKRYNSYENGYNLTTGGDGGNTRGKIKLNDYYFIYFGNKKYPGMTNRTAQMFNIDSSTVSAIVREKSYLSFLEQAKKLPEQERIFYEKKFYKNFDIENNKPWTVKKTLDDETTFNIMCVVSSYGRGIEKTILDKFNLSKGFIFHLMTGNGRTEIKEKYKHCSQQQIELIGEKYFLEWELMKYSKVSLKKKYTNLFEKYSK